VEALLAAAELPIDGLSDQFPESYAVAEANGALAGAAGIERHGRDGLLRSVVISPEWRGRGMGERLVRERLGWAVEQGLGTVYLLTTTAPAYFPRLGFRPAERADVPEVVRASSEFTNVCPASAVLLALPLTEADPSTAEIEP
jgi:N-acetylglutamate synthase-like GNAT family acetyltransferase